MPFLEWSDEFLTGNNKMDQQHKEWLRILNDFYDTLNMDNLQENLIRMLDDAIHYAYFHFKEEEAFMAKHNFQDLAIQKKEHAWMKKELLDFKIRFKEDMLYISQPVTDEMKKWFFDHVTGLDKNYGKLPQD